MTNGLVYIKCKDRKVHLVKVGWDTHQAFLCRPWNKIRKYTQGLRKHNTYFLDHFSQKADYFQCLLLKSECHINLLLFDTIFKIVLLMFWHDIEWIQGHPKIQKLQTTTVWTLSEWSEILWWITFSKDKIITEILRNFIILKSCIWRHNIFYIKKWHCPRKWQ